MSTLNDQLYFSRGSLGERFGMPFPDDSAQRDHAAQRNDRYRREMSRRRKQSTFEDLIDIAAMLPWKWGVAFAVAAYLCFHYMATLPPATPEPMTAKNFGQAMGSAMGRQMTITFGLFLQYIVPIAFLLGSGLSFFKQRKRIRLHTNVENSPGPGALEAMSWQEFEALVAEAFSRKGYKVLERGGAGPDGGVDVELRMGNDKYLVQCKQWKVRQVGVAPVRELYGVMAAEGAVGGFIVASGGFTDEARKFAEGRSIKVMDANSLLAMISPASGARVSKAEVPDCPKCGSTMAKRVAKQGENAGKPFWGCSRFPACRGIRSL